MSNKKKYTNNHEKNKSLSPHTEYLQVDLKEYTKDPERYIALSKERTIVEVKDEEKTILIIGTPSKSLFPIEQDEVEDFEQKQKKIKVKASFSWLE